MVSSSRSFDIAENCEQITADAATIEVLFKLEACVRDPFQEFGIELPRNEKSTSKGEVQSFELGKSRNEIRIGLGPTWELES